MINPQIIALLVILICIFVTVTNYIQYRKCGKMYPKLRKRIVMSLAGIGIAVLTIVNERMI